MDDADQRLAGRERTDDFLADRLGPDCGDEFLDDGQRDVGLEQGEAHLAQRVADVGLGEARFAAELLDDAAEPLGQVIEHVGAGCDGTARPRADRSGPLAAQVDGEAAPQRQRGRATLRDVEAPGPLM